MYILICKFTKQNCMSIKTCVPVKLLAKLFYSIPDLLNTGTVFLQISDQFFQSPNKSANWRFNDF